MAKRLAAAGALATLPSAPQDRPAGATRLATYTRGIVALAVVGGLAVSCQVTQQSSTTRTTAPVAALSGERSAPDAMTPAEEAPSVRVDDPETSTLSVDQLPTATAPTAIASAAAPGGDVRRPRVTSPTAATEAIAASELELLQRAQAALTVDPERALSITSEQARAYPSGEFVQEREVIAVEALSRMGRKDDALRRARALVERFPRTPYGDRLEIAVGRAL